MGNQIDKNNTNIMCNIRKRINRYLNEEIKRNEKIITEKWPYYDKMDDMMHYVYNAISQNLPNGVIYNIYDGIWLKKGNIPNLCVFDINHITLEYYVYVCSNDELCKLIIDEGYSENNFDEKNKTLTITLYTVLYQLVEEPSNKNLSHELEHILQISNGSKYNKNYSELIDNAYKQASEVISNSANYNPADILLAWLIYYSNPHEQDAFINEYYQDLRSNKQFINDEDSATHIKYKDYISKYEFFLNNIQGEKINNAIKRYGLFGYNLKNFQIMCEKGSKRFFKKMKNVEKHFKGVIKNANENHFHLSPITNGSIIYL